MVFAMDFFYIETKKKTVTKYGPCQEALKVTGGLCKMPKFPERAINHDFPWDEVE